MQRRSFLKQAGSAPWQRRGHRRAGICPGFAVVEVAPGLRFPQRLDLRFGAGETFCKFVSESTGGKFSIRHLPEGEVAPAAELVDAVGAGKVECAHASSALLHARNPAFASMPACLSA